MFSVFTGMADKIIFFVDETYYFAIYMSKLYLFSILATKLSVG